MASAANIVHSTARRTATTMMMMMTMQRPLPLLAPPPPAASISSPLLDIPAVPMQCGRGDKRTKKGKRFKGSYGNARPKKEKMIERLKDKLEVPRSTPWPLPFKIM